MKTDSITIDCVRERERRIMTIIGQFLQAISELMKNTIRIAWKKIIEND